LSSLRLNVYLYNTRYIILLKEDPHRTNRGINEPLNGALRIFNEFPDLFEFSGSREQEINRILLVTNIWYPYVKFELFDH
jgi:hypothetical protein